MASAGVPRVTPNHAILVIFTQFLTWSFDP